MSGVIVLKYGGSAMEDSAKVMEILREISLLVQEGFSVVLIHGGGKEISGEMDRRGLKAVFAQGFRVTDEAAMAVVISPPQPLLDAGGLLQGQLQQSLHFDMQQAGSGTP